jgi:hypothetical protein
MRKAIILCLIILCGFEAFSQARAPKYSNEFLSIGVGASALGMSNAQVSHVNDVTAGYWNPAGLTGIANKYEFSLMHAEYFAGIANFDYAGFATPIDSVSYLGLSVIRFAVDNIPDTRFLYDANGAVNYDNIRFFSAADYAFLLSYARKTKMLPGLSYGANFKVVHRMVGNFANAWGFGLDAGLQWRKKTWRLGLMLRDVTGTFNAWSHNSELLIDVYNQTGNVIPENSVEITLPKAILGGSKYFNIGKRFGLLAALDVDFTVDGKRNVLLGSRVVSLDPKVGMELNFDKIVFLRGGAGNIQKVKNFDGTYYNSYQPNFGIGIRVKNVSLDYALTDIGNQSEALYSHVFSIRAGLN